MLYDFSFRQSHKPETTLEIENDYVQKGTELEHRSHWIVTACEEPSHHILSTQRAGLGSAPDKIGSKQEFFHLHDSECAIEVEY